MYKSFTGNELKKIIGLPEDYKVKAFISYGTWDHEKQFKIIQEVLKDLNIEYSSQRLSGFLSSILEIRIKNEVYWFACVYGGAKLSEYIHMACLFGSEKNISIGSCGGLYPEINSTDIIIPTYSYGKESSCALYDKNNEGFKYYPNEKLSKNIEIKINKKYKVWRGPIITCHAMLAETLEDVQSWSKDGFYGVEMETSTIFAVSKYFNIPSVGIIYVTDNLIKGQTVGDESHKQETHKRDGVRSYIYKIAIQAVLNII